MKKKLWMGLMLAAAFCVCVGAAVYGDDNAQINCIGDTSGKTNCISAPEAGAGGADSIALDSEVLEFGHIVEAGRRYSKVLTVRNASSAVATLQLEVVSYESDALDEQQKKVVDWIAFGGGKRKFDLAAGADAQVSVRLMVPADAKGGTYYARIKVSNGGGGEKYVTVKADLALDGYNYDGKVLSQKIGYFNVDGKAVATARVKNDGTAGFAAHYEVQYKNAFGLPEWKKITEEDREILPGAEETFEVSDDVAAIGYGIFTVEQKISYINSENRQVEAVLSHAVINLPWWGLAIAVAVVLLIIMIAVVLARARRKKAEKGEKAASKKSRKKSAVEVVEED